MTVSEGSKLPDATLLKMGESGPEAVELAEFAAGRKLVLFALPGAYTGQCTTKHIPSFVRTADAFRERGIDEVVCVAVNDPFVLAAWAQSTGASDAGITFLADADGSFTKSLGMDFDAPPIGLYGRSNRYAVVLDDGVITVANVDEPTVCHASTGEELLARL